MPGWFIEPEAVTFTAERTDRRTSSSSTTAPTDSPPVVRFRAACPLVRSDPTYTVTPLGGGRYRASGSDTIDNEVFGVSVPGEPDPIICLAVSSVRHADGWVNRSRQRGAVPTRVPVLDLVALDPFTAEEVLARCLQRPPRGPYVPVILAGDATPVGDKIINDRAGRHGHRTVGHPDDPSKGLTLLTLESPGSPSRSTRSTCWSTVWRSTLLASSRPSRRSPASSTSLSDECTPAPARFRSGAGPTVRPRWAWSGRHLPTRSTAPAPREASSSVDFNEFKATVVWGIKNAATFEPRA